MVRYSLNTPPRISAAKNRRSMILAARSQFSQAAMMCATSTGAYVVPRQDCLLSCQLCPTFPPGWKERGIVLLTERSTRDKIRTQAVDSGLDQSEAFPPLSPEHSDVEHERDVMLPIKGKRMRTFESLCSDLWLWTLGLS